MVQQKWFLGSVAALCLLMAGPSLARAQSFYASCWEDVGSGNLIVELAWSGQQPPISEGRAIDQNPAGGAAHQFTDPAANGIMYLIISQWASGDPIFCQINSQDLSNVQRETIYAPAK